MYNANASPLHIDQLQYCHDYVDDHFVRLHGVLRLWCYKSVILP